MIFKNQFIKKAALLTLFSFIFNSTIGYSHSYLAAQKLQNTGNAESLLLERSLASQTQKSELRARSKSITTNQYSEELLTRILASMDRHQADQLGFDHSSEDMALRVEFFNNQKVLVDSRELLHMTPELFEQFVKWLERETNIKPEATAGKLEWTVNGSEKQYQVDIIKSKSDPSIIAVKIHKINRAELRSFHDMDQTTPEEKFVIFYNRIHELFPELNLSVWDWFVHPLRSFKIKIVILYLIKELYRFEKLFDQSIVEFSVLDQIAKRILKLELALGVRDESRKFKVRTSAKDDGSDGLEAVIVPYRALQPASKEPVNALRGVEEIERLALEIVKGGKLPVIRILGKKSSGISRLAHDLMEREEFAGIQKEQFALIDDKILWGFGISRDQMDLDLPSDERSNSTGLIIVDNSWWFERISFDGVPVEIETVDVWVEASDEECWARFMRDVQDNPMKGIESVLEISNPVVRDIQEIYLGEIRKTNADVVIYSDELLAKIDSGKIPRTKVIPKKENRSELRLGTEVELESWIEQIEGLREEDRTRLFKEFLPLMHNPAFRAILKSERIKNLLKQLRVYYRQKSKEHFFAKSSPVTKKAESIIRSLVLGRFGIVSLIFGISVWALFLLKTRRWPSFYELTFVVFALTFLSKLDMRQIIFDQLISAVFYSNQKYSVGSSGLIAFLHAQEHGNSSLDYFKQSIKIDPTAILWPTKVELPYAEHFPALFEFHDDLMPNGGVQVHVNGLPGIWKPLYDPKNNQILYVHYFDFVRDDYFLLKLNEPEVFEYYSSVSDRPIRFPSMIFDGNRPIVFGRHVAGFLKSAVSFTRFSSWSKELAGISGFKWWMLEPYFADQSDRGMQAREVKLISDFSQINSPRTPIYFKTPKKRIQIPDMIGLSHAFGGRLVVAEFGRHRLREHRHKIESAIKIARDPEYQFPHQSTHKIDSMIYYADEIMESGRLSSPPRSSEQTEAIARLVAQFVQSRSNIPPDHQLKTPEHEAVFSLLNGVQWVANQIKKLHDTDLKPMELPRKLIFVVDAGLFLSHEETKRPVEITLILRNDAEYVLSDDGFKLLRAFNPFSRSELRNIHVVTSLKQIKVGDYIRYDGVVGRVVSKTSSRMRVEFPDGEGEFTDASFKFGDIKRASESEHRALLRVLLNPPVRKDSVEGGIKSQGSESKKILKPSKILRFARYALHKNREKGVLEGMPIASVYKSLLREYSDRSDVLEFDSRQVLLERLQSIARVILKRIRNRDKGEINLHTLNNLEQAMIVGIVGLKLGKDRSFGRYVRGEEVKTALRRALTSEGQLTEDAKVKAHDYVTTKSSLRTKVSIEELNTGIERAFQSLPHVIRDIVKNSSENLNNPLSSRARLALERNRQLPILERFYQAVLLLAALKEYEKKSSDKSRQKEVTRLTEELETAIRLRAEGVFDVQTMTHFEWLILSVLWKVHYFSIDLLKSRVIKNSEKVEFQTYFEGRQLKPERKSQIDKTVSRLAAEFFPAKKKVIESEIGGALYRLRRILKPNSESEKSEEKRSELRKSLRVSPENLFYDLNGRSDIDMFVEKMSQNVKRVARAFLENPSDFSLINPRLETEAVILMNNLTKSGAGATPILARRLVEAGHYVVIVAEPIVRDALVQADEILGKSDKIKIVSAPEEALSFLNHPNNNITRRRAIGLKGTADEENAQNLLIRELADEKTMIDSFDELFSISGFAKALVATFHETYETMIAA